MHNVLDHIRAHPDEHDQGAFRAADGLDLVPCGTTLCFAGWVCQLTGGEWLGDSELLYAERADWGYGNFQLGGVSRLQQSLAGLDLPEDTLVSFPDERAQRLLRIDHDTADELFYSCEDLASLEATVAALENEHKVP